MTTFSEYAWGAYPGATAEVFNPYNFTAPAYQGKALSTLLPGVVHALGHAETVLGDAAEHGRLAAQAWGLVPDAPTALIVVDGLGYFNIQDYQHDAPFLAALNAQHAPATVGFPSTTAASMSILGTGKPAGLTGVISYSAMNPHTGESGNFVSWRDLPDPARIQREPVLLEELVRAGVRIETIGLERYNGSGLTQAALRGPKYREKSDLRGSFSRIKHNLEGGVVSHFYWAEIDKLGHYYGVGSYAWRDALREFDSELERFATTVPSGTQIVITADHGMINPDPHQRVDIAKNFALNRSVRGIAGEPRCTHVYFNSASGAKSAQQRWVEEIGTRGLVLTRSEVLELGLYGPVAAHVEPWIGHLVILAAQEATIVDSQSMSAMAIGLKGVHGSLTATEMTVPGIVHSAL